MELETFKSSNAATDSEQTFQKENSYTLDVAVEGEVMAKAGSMIGYTGDISFTGKASAEGGITGFIKEAATSEGTPVMSVEGSGHVYLADGGKKVVVLDLDADEEITVNGEDVLAFESGVSYEIGSIDSLAGAAAGGLTNLYLTGPGSVAITLHGDPLVLTPPVSTDPSATVAWSGVSPSVDVNRSLSDMVGQESGERYQMNFTGGDGFVVVQPYEELTPTQQA
ncbi:MAG: AIM24 family protein [Halobacteriales archaeon]